MSANDDKADAESREYRAELAQERAIAEAVAAHHTKIAEAVEALRKPPREYGNLIERVEVEAWNYAIGSAFAAINAIAPESR